MSMFDKIIEEKANSHEARVPSDAWANIEKKKKRRRFFFLWLICLLLCGSLGIVFYSARNIKPVTSKIEDRNISNQARQENNFRSQIKGGEKAISGAVGKQQNNQ